MPDHDLEDAIADEVAKRERQKKVDPDPVVEPDPLVQRVEGLNNKARAEVEILLDRLEERKVTPPPLASAEVAVAYEALPEGEKRRVERLLQRAERRNRNAV